MRRRATARLSEAGVENAARDVELLLRWATGLDAPALVSRAGEAATAEARVRFESALSRREARAPVSHIVGGRAFWGRWFEVTPDVLDPRPESETLIAAALERAAGAAPPARVLDLGVGSGCLLGTVLAERREATGLGIDASRAALAVAARNMAALEIADRAEMRLGDWLDGLTEGFDMILCNPPYIARAEMDGLSPEVLEHEPRIALTPGGDGLDAYRRIAPDLACYLRRGGRALFEIGPDQAAQAATIFAAFGWPHPIVHRDMDGRDRCLEYRRKP
ncbi:peptide chain release factor N(5)-glutamine methyltransferase [Pikeienuella piscinae]|uniref:Release factor glutamine methyltransferase n=1 Tax=Pikeienuella piscinae TaxID=2748098 RepID=A0A7M3T6X5_9RHOB|nr:peptide chain release factor N(5)-glutamine methyltransferase [Pikeienuella piscinae]